MEWLKTAWEWLKKNWPNFLFALLIVAAFVFLYMRQCSSDGLYNKLLQDYNDQADSFSEQMKAYERVNREWQAKQEALNEEHREKMECIERDYKKGLESISKRREIRQVKIVREARRDPTTLTQRVYEVFGIPIVGEEGQ